MQKLLLLGTLAVVALACSQAAADDFYNQKIADQAHQYSLDVAANLAFQATEAGNWSGTVPGSMASDTGLQNTGDDFYNQRIAAQAQQYRLGEASIAAAGGVPRGSESWNGPQPESMAADVEQSADNDFYNQKVQEQADLNSRILLAQTLDASSSTEPESWSSQEPGSMAANVGSQSAGGDFYDQIVAIQANVNRIGKAANQF